MVEHWEYINSICFLFKRKVVVHFRQYYSAQKCRIIFSDNKTYYNAKINVKILGKKLLFLMGRLDGLGVRLVNLVNLMYFSKITGNNFGFVWHPLNDLKFTILTTPTEDKIFSQNFIERYSYTSLISRDICRQKQGALYLKSLIYSNTKDSQKYRLNDFSYLPSEFDWGNFYYFSRLSQYFKEIKKNDYQKDLSKLWKKIEFSDNICLFQNYVDRISTNYKEYDAIHIRLVDIAYKSFAYRFIFPDKALIVEFFLCFFIK